jgi:hypothetical protein
VFLHSPRAGKQLVPPSTSRGRPCSWHGWRKGDLESSSGCASCGHLGSLVREGKRDPEARGKRALQRNSLGQERERLWSRVWEGRETIHPSHFPQAPPHSPQPSHNPGAMRSTRSTAAASFLPLLPLAAVVYSQHLIKGDQRAPKNGLVKALFSSPPTAARTSTLTLSRGMVRSSSDFCERTSGRKPACAVNGVLVH